MDLRYRLWGVVAGASVLLVVVLAGGLYWLRPAAAVTRAGGDPWRPLARPSEMFEYVSDQSTPVQPTVAVGAPVVADAVTADAAAPEAGRPQESRNAVATEPAPRQEAAPASAPAPAPAPAPRRDARSPAAEVQSPKAALPAPRPVEQAAPAPEPARAQLPLKPFWIQVGSFVSHGRALALGEQLSRQGLNNRITIRETDSEVFYRVRVGPYATRLEAERSLDSVRAVDGLDGSYVTEAAARA